MIGYQNLAHFEDRPQVSSHMTKKSKKKSSSESQECFTLLLSCTCGLISVGCPTNAKFWLILDHFGSTLTFKYIWTPLGERVICTIESQHIRGRIRLAAKLWPNLESTPRVSSLGQQQQQQQLS